MLGGASGGGGGESAGVDVGVADEDDSDLSKKIVDALNADKGLALQGGTKAVVRAAVRTGKVVVAVVIPKRFGRTAPKTMFGPGDKPVLGLLF